MCKWPRWKEQLNDIQLHTHQGEYHELPTKYNFEMGIYVLILEYLNHRVKLCQVNNSNRQ